MIIKGCKQNNLKNIDLTLPKNKLIVFTGVSGSGKSSIVFDTIAAESQRQMNETYSTYVRGRLPKYNKPDVDYIDELTASVIVDQSRIGGNARSTVGTISDMYASLRLLYARIGEPYVGMASHFSFNNPNGMCKTCSGIGKIMKLDIYKFIDPNKSLNEGMLDLPAYHVGKYYWKQYVNSGLFDPDKKFKDYSEQEVNLLLYGSYTKDGPRINKKIEGIAHQMERLSLMKDVSEQSDYSMKKIQLTMKEEVCPDCKGARLNPRILECRIQGYNIIEMSNLEFTKLLEVLNQIQDSRGKFIIESLKATLQRMIDIGLSYLFLNRETTTLSGGEAQRLKIVRYMGSSLTNMTYIFDEPTTGLHPRDVHRMANLLLSLRDKGNTVIVVEHDKDIIKIADEIVDVGPLAGKYGGNILFQGSYEDLLLTNTLTGKALSTKVEINTKPNIPTRFLPVRNANIHNLKNIDVDIPLDVFCVVTGVAGSGKSSLIRDVFAKQYEDQVILIDQSAITATSRSTVCSYLGFFDEIRKIFANTNHQDIGMFSFNSIGACPVCKGKGAITTELVFMDPVTTTCEVCNGDRYSDEAKSYRYKGKNIVEVLKLTVEEALDFFNDQPKILKYLKALNEVGLPYMSLGQPLSTFSGGERQRVKLAKYIHKKGNIYILDEPTTGLHPSDIVKLIDLFKRIIKKGNTIIVIEHNLDVLKQADYIIDIGVDGGTNGGEVTFTGTLQEMIENSNCITAKYLRLDL